MLQRLTHTEGSVTLQTDGSYAHEYVLRDHLGNTRVTFSDLNNDGLVGSMDIKQINSYYPFGLNMESNFNGAGGKNKYAYNGKEWNDDFSLGWNDYGARFYDPAIARWTTKDPLSEKYLLWSLYNYAIDNPVKYIDYDGRDLIVTGPGTQQFLDQVNKGLGGFYTANIDPKTNVVTLTKNGEAKGQISDTQNAFYQMMNIATDPKKKNISIEAVKSDEDIIIGSYSASKIDVDDLEKFGDSGAMTTSALIGHEMSEQVTKQRSGKSDYSTDHENAAKVEDAINGNTRMDVKSIAPTSNIKEVEKSNGKGKAISGDIDTRFKVGEKEVTVRVTLEKGNVTKVDQNYKKP